MQMVYTLIGSLSPSKPTTLVFALALALLAFVVLVAVFFAAAVAFVAVAFAAGALAAAVDLDAAVVRVARVVAGAGGGVSAALDVARVVRVDARVGACVAPLPDRVAIESQGARIVVEVQVWVQDLSGCGCDAWWTRLMGMRYGHVPRVRFLSVTCRARDAP